MTLFLAETPEDFDLIYRLRYRAYRSIEAIPANDDERFSDDFDQRARSFVFGLRRDDTIMCSMRVIVSETGGRDLTAYRAFTDAIESNFSPSECVLEVNRFVVEPDFDAALGSVEHQLRLFRGLAYTCLTYRADHYIGATRRNHMAFYRRVVYMRPVSEPRLYPGLSVSMTLLSGPFIENYQRVCKRWGGKFLVEAEDLELWKSRLASRELAQTDQTAK